MSEKVIRRTEVKLKADQDQKKKLCSLRKENEHLRRSLNYEKSLIRGLPLGFMVIQDEKVMDANDEILGHLGYAPEEIFQRGLREFLPDRLKRGFEEIFGKGRSSKSGSDLNEIELIGKDGTVVAYDMRVRKIRSKGRSLFLALFVRNEKRKKREKNILESAKECALRTMAAGLGAALNGPVRSIRESVVLAEQSLGPGHGQNLRGLESGLLGVERLGRAIELLAKDTEGPSLRAPVDLRKVLKEALAFSALRAQEKADSETANIKVKTYLRSVSRVEGDPVEIRKMLSYLIMNAEEAMPGGGSLYLSTEENGGYAHVYIQDSGGGISPEILERVFDPFFTTKGRGNYGLGLSLSRAIIRRHHGEIEITSNNNEGTAVTIRLPLVKREEQDAKRKPRNTGIRHARILIIEEASMIGRVLLETLSSKGSKVETASDVTDGLAQVRRKAFDLVIVCGDIGGVKGESLVRRIKRSKSVLPVALIADGVGFDESDIGRSPLVDLIIRKPIDMSQAIERITEIISAGT
ncbi:MAG: response regulator [Deltaproteobacteria bacterium]|nr:response regulator [Deltaproteobacteria bacterium]